MNFKTLLTGLFLTFTVAGWAQQQNNADQTMSQIKNRAQKMTQEVASAVHLTPGEAISVYSINMGTSREIQYVQEQMHSLRAQLDAIEADSHKKMQAVLTPEQMATLDSLQAAKKAQSVAAGKAGGTN